MVHPSEAFAAHEGFSQVVRTARRGHEVRADNKVGRANLRQFGSGPLHLPTAVRPNTKSPFGDTADVLEAFQNVVALKHHLIVARKFLGAWNIPTDWDEDVRWGIDSERKRW
jgi:hypothetical protein